MRLVCVECGEKSKDGEGWRAALAVKLVDDDFDEEGQAEVAVFCPRCWSREFSDA